VINATVLAGFNISNWSLHPEFPVCWIRLNLVLNQKAKAIHDPGSNLAVLMVAQAGATDHAGF
jgi:hypothetical protein